jgi:hypothetical protein
LICRFQISSMRSGRNRCTGAGPDGGRPPDASQPLPSRKRQNARIVRKATILTATRRLRVNPLRTGIIRVSNRLRVVPSKRLGPEPASTALSLDLRTSNIGRTALPVGSTLP